MGIKHYPKSIQIYKSVGKTGDVKIMAGDVARIKAQQDGTAPESSDEVKKTNAQDSHYQLFQG